MNVEATAESRPACHRGQRIWTYAARRTHEYESNIQVLIALLHKLQLRLYPTVGVDTGHKGVIVEDRGTHSSAVVSGLGSTMVGNVAEAHLGTGKWVVVGGSKGERERRGTQDG